MFEEDFKESVQDTQWDEEIQLSPDNSKEYTDLKFRHFNCCGEQSFKNTQLHQNSYVCNEELKYICETRENVDNTNDVVNFSNVTFYTESFNLFDIETILNCVRKNIFILESAAISNSNIYNSSFENKKNYYLLRYNVCKALFYIRHLLNRILQNHSYVWMLDDFIPKLESSLLMLKIFFSNFKKLPEFIIQHAASKLGNESQQAVHHFFHCYLDLQWLYLTLSVRLIQYRQSISSQRLPDTECSQSYSTKEDSDESKLEKEILCVLSDLMQVSIIRFEKIPVVDLNSKSSFSCSCVKELWLMMQLFIEHLNASGHCKEFSYYFNILMSDVICKKLVEFSSNKYGLDVTKSVVNNNKYIFAIWLLSNVTELYGYDTSGNYIGPESKRVQSNYLLLETSLRAWIATETSGPTEVALRSVLSLVTPLLLKWWDPKIEVMAIFWEYFHKNLNSAFYVPGSAPKTLAIVSKNPQSLLEQIKHRINSTSHKCTEETSYHTFLRLLGLVLKKCINDNQINQWQKMKGRIFPKFPPSKLIALNETGLYNFVSLFLTLAVTTDLQEVGTAFGNLISKLPETIEINRKCVVICAQLAFMNLYIEDNVDISEACPTLLVHLTNNTDNKSFGEMIERTVISGIKDIIETSQALELGEDLLISAWIHQYLSNNKSRDNSFMYDFILTVTSKLHVLYTQRMFSYNVSERKYRKITNNLFCYVLPYVKQVSHSANVSYQLASVAVAFTVLCLDDKDVANKNGCSFVSMFKHFVASPLINFSMSVRYLSLLLASEGVMDVLAKEVPDYQVVIIQTWIHSALLCSEETSLEIQEITRVVIHLPEMLSLCTLSETDEPIFSFFSQLGQNFKATQDFEKRYQLHTKLTQLLGDIDKKMVNLLRTNPPDKTAILRSYSALAILYLHCAPLMYIKNKPTCMFHSLTVSVLLPPALYTGKKLHTFGVLAIRKTWHLFYRGISEINHKTDPYIEKTLTDFVVQYVPYFANSPEISGYPQPLLKLFDAPFTGESVVFVFDKICASHVKCKGKVSRNNATLALKILIDIVNSVKENPVKLQLIIKSTCEGVLEQLMFLDHLNPSRHVASDLFDLIISSTAYKENKTLQDELLQVVKRLCLQHLAFYTTYTMQLMISLASKCTGIMDEALPFIREQVNSIERMRGTGHDTHLRTLLQKMESALEINKRNRF